MSAATAFRVALFDVCDRANIRKWVNALRSGEYRQSRGSLRATDAEGTVTFCCLGVACDISGLGTWDRGEYAIPGEANAAGNLAEPVAAWLGVSLDPLLHGVHSRRSATALNDYFEWDFLGIADAIERTFLTP